MENENQIIETPKNNRDRMYITIIAVILILSGLSILYLWKVKSAGNGQIELRKEQPFAPAEEGAKSISGTGEKLSNKMLEIETPTSGQKIKSPFKISGKSNFFEATTSIRVKDEKGKVLAETFATADGWMDKLYPFYDFVSYNKPGSEKGVVELFEISAKDGSEQNKISIPVVFSDFSSYPSGISADFENMVNEKNFSKSDAILAPEVNFILEASECCGKISKVKAKKELIDTLGVMTNPANFSQDQEEVKKLKNQPAEFHKLYTDYYKNYIVGIGSDDGGRMIITYHANSLGKVDAVYFSISADQYEFRDLK